MSYSDLFLPSIAIDCRCTPAWSCPLKRIAPHTIVWSVLECLEWIVLYNIPFIHSRQNAKDRSLGVGRDISAVSKLTYLYNNGRFWSGRQDMSLADIFRRRLQHSPSTVWTSRRCSAVASSLSSRSREARRKPSASSRRPPPATLGSLSRSSVSYFSFPVCLLSAGNSGALGVAEDSPHAVNLYANADNRKITWKTMSPNVSFLTFSFQSIKKIK